MIYIVIGAVVGWTFSLVLALCGDMPQRVVLNMCVGVIGAGTSNFLLALDCKVDHPELSDFFSRGMIYAVNALVLLALMHFAQHKKES